EMLLPELRANTVRIQQDNRGVTLSLAEAGFFDSGAAVINAGGLQVLERIAEKLDELSQGIPGEGHKGNKPIHNAPFSSNWEVSTARATNVLQYLITNAKIPPPRLSAIGYGEYRPAASNQTAEGRASNRRVDLVILSPDAQTLEPAKR